jgi:transcriptional regulator with XRE-family HTH domain
MAETDAGRARLAAQVQARRRQRGLSLRAAAAAAGIDRDTWSSLEEGRRETQDSKFAGIERALGWPTGEIARILDDHQATAADDPNRRALAGHPDLLGLYDEVVGNPRISELFRENAVAGLLALAAGRDSQQHAG